MLLLTGIDVSHHQGAVDWGAVRRAGHTFAFCKATDGAAYSFASYYQAQAPRIRAAGLVPGAYHWLKAGPAGELRDPAGQARYFRSVVGNPAGLLCALDVESLRNQNGALISAPRIDSVRAFAAEWRRITGGHPLIVYTGRWYWVGMIGNPSAAGLGPLWHSEYETSAAEVADGPELDNYGGWGPCTFWQYTSTGSVPGVAGNCDVNQFRGGDKTALLALTGTTQENDMELAELLNSDAFWNKMLAQTAGASQAGAQNALDHTARLVGGITNMEAYLEALLKAARDAATVPEVATQAAKVIAAIPTVDAIATAVVAKLPTTSGGGVTREEVKAAVRDVFAEVRYTVAPADIPPP